ncbi:MAG TPA: amidohydrolase family protein, partial [Pirellulales bacterium]
SFAERHGVRSLQSSFTRLKARFVITAEGPPLRDAVVVIEGSRIAAVESHRSADPVAIDLGNAAILPGLINAHTHLEFSNLAAPLGRPGIPFTDWIRLVVAHRRNRSDADRQEAIAAGLEECSRSGTTCIGEISTDGSAASGPRADLIVFLEILGLKSDRIEAGIAAAREHVARSQPAHRSAGISPHAPYSVRPELLEGLAEISASDGVPLAMHIGESREEMELLASGGGPMREMLIDFNAWSPDVFATPRRPLDHLKVLAAADRALVIHGNYLADDEIAFIAARRSKIAVVYCPRTHAYFGHSPYPLAKMLESGAVVALGTDSRASNPDLNLLAEMREAFVRHSIDPARIVEMGTINGAIALGRDHETGSIAPGKRADLAIVRLTATTGDDPYELLFDPKSFVETTIYGGDRRSQRAATVRER